ncbi:MAG: cation transporting ATPase C-terminal domain-containing protein, partial [Streptococcus sp.]|nr:cation transporting ATPase C-terminal domain-containing protein [Streptococcus sp.]
GVMTHKPRGRKSNFFDGGVFGAIIYQGIFQTMLVLGVYGWALLFPEHQSHTEIHADALTMAFATLGLIQLLHAFNVKSVYQSIFKVGLFTNKTFNWSIPVAFVLFVVTILVPGFNNLFHVSHLSLTQWMVVAVGALMIVVLVEIVKAVQRALGKDKNAI